MYPRQLGGKYAGHTAPGRLLCNIDHLNDLVQNLYLLWTDRSGCHGAKRLSRGGAAVTGRSALQQTCALVSKDGRVIVDEEFNLIFFKGTKTANIYLRL